MLKIVYRICCGMDVHKSFVVACIASTNEHGVTNLQKQAVFHFHWGFTPVCRLAF